MRTLLPLLGVSLFSSALTLAAALLVLAPASRAEPAVQIYPALQAQRFDLVDAGGVLRARLGVEADGTAALSMVDGTGQPRATFTLTSADVAVVQVRNPQGANATLSALPTGVIGVGLVDQGGSSRAGLGLSPDGSPVLEVGHRLQDQPSARAQISELPDGTLGLGIVDPAGRPRVGLATTPDGTPGLSLLDAAGRPRALAGLATDGTAQLRLLNDGGGSVWQAP
jgi:hypothetical protein